jgi:hypothetical protein
MAKKKEQTPEPVMPSAGKIAEYAKAQPERVKAVQYTGENAAELTELTGWRCVPVPQGPGLRRVCLRTSQPSATAASAGESLRHAAGEPLRHAAGEPLRHAAGEPLPFLAGTGRQAPCLGNR